MNDKLAIKFLKAAIKLHHGHMNGTVPTNEKTQAQMMTLMEKALNSLTGEGGMSH